MIFPLPLAGGEQGVGIDMLAPCPTIPAPGRARKRQGR
jgi:hypothetical protein